MVLEKPYTKGHTLYDFIHAEYPRKGDGGLEMDMLEDLESLQFERGIEEEDHSWLYLQCRCRGLLIKGCAHATFFCKLLHDLSKLLQEKQTSRRPSTESLARPPDDDRLKVGIIGGGHLGKQLARVLLQLVPVSAERLRISTRRPEALDEFQNLGVQCFYDNSYLVGWANLVFLCCLPSQLPSICTEIQSSFEKDCIVYSFVSAIPIPRLRNLLNHTNILRPQYQCAEGFANIEGANKEIIAALQDPVVLQATCPFNPAGGVILNIKWLDGVFYAALNVCTAKATSLSQALQLLNELFPSVHLKKCRKDGASCPKFQLWDFLHGDYAENLSPESPLPWFDLTAAQLRETDFSDNLLTRPALQEHLTHLYCNAFGIALPEEQQRVACTGSLSQ